MILYYVYLTNFFVYIYIYIMDGVVSTFPVDA